MLQKLPATLHYQQSKYWNTQEFASAINKHILVALKETNIMKIRALNQEKANEDFKPDNTRLIQTGIAVQDIFRHFYLPRKKF